MEPTRYTQRFRFVICALALALSRLMLPAAQPQISAGEDWSLPSWAEPVPYSGLFTMNNNVNHPLIEHIGFTLTWFDLNPEEDVYDFHWVEDKLAEAKARGAMVMFRMKSSVIDGPEQGTVNNQRQMVPQWVVDKHNPATFRTRADKRYIALWDSGVQAEWRKFILEFGKRGYLASPYCMGIYLHGFSPSNGEELGINSETFTDEAKAAGLTAQVIHDCFTFRMDAWKEAAGPHVYKVAFVNAGAIVGLNYDRDGLVQEAFDRGLGWRGGLIEHYYYGFLHPPLAGQRFENGYMISDWNSPVHNGRIFSDENEEGDSYDPLEPGKELDFMGRSPYFRAAQVGINFLWVGPPTITRAGGNDGIVKWYTLIAGKRPAESPDAACWLREAQVRGLGSQLPRPYKNMERMLYQRDLPGSMSVADEPYDLPYVQLKDLENTVEHTARRTNVDEGQHSLAFLLDPDFKASLSYPVAIKVHYLDKNQATWTVRVSTTGGSTEDLGVVEGQGDNVWRTATFTSTAPFVPGALGGDVDFTVQALSGGDVTVRYVRVIRTVDSQRAPEIRVQPTSRTMDSGHPLALSVVARGTMPLHYQWKKNGVPIAGATDQHLDFGTVAAADSGVYTVGITNTAGSVESEAAILDIVDSPPVIVTQPTGTTVEPTTPVKLYVEVTGSRPLTYSWTKDGQPVGGNSKTLNLGAVTDANAGTYRVTVTNAFGTVTSAAAVLNVIATPPSIVTAPLSQTADAGSQVTFSVVASGSVPLSYEWRRDGVTIAGATGASLVLNNVSLSDAGDYTVTINNSAGTVTSEPATLRVLQAFADWIAPFGLSPEASEPLATPANDGVANLIAYGLSLDPGVDKGALLPATTLVNADGGPPVAGQPRYVALDVTRNPAAMHIDWRAEVSSDLATWDGSSTATAVLVDTPARWLVRDATNIDEAGRRFIRFAVGDATPTGPAFVASIDDFEDGDHTSPNWTRQMGGGGNVTLGIAGEGTPNGLYCLSIEYNAANTFQYAVLSRNTATFGAAWAAGEVDALRFWIKGSPANGLSADDVMRVQVREGSSGDRWSYNIPAAIVNSGEWHQLVAPLGDFYSDETSGTPVFELEKVDQVRFYCNRAGREVTIFVDQIEAIKR